MKILKCITHCAIFLASFYGGIPLNAETFVSVARNSTPQSGTVSRVDLDKTQDQFFTVKYSNDGVQFLDYIDVSVRAAEGGAYDVTYIALVIDLSNPDSIKRFKDTVRISKEKKSEIKLKSAGEIVFKIED